MIYPSQLSASPHVLKKFKTQSDIGFNLQEFQEWTVSGAYIIKQEEKSNFLVKLKMVQWVVFMNFGFFFHNDQNK